MSPDDLLNELKELYLAAIELEPGDRRQFIEKACTGNVELKEMLNHILEEHDHPSALFDRPAWSLLEDRKKSDCGDSNEP